MARPFVKGVAAERLWTSTVRVGYKRIASSWLTSLRCTNVAVAAARGKQGSGQSHCHLEACDGLTASRALQLVLADGCLRRSLLDV